MPNNIYNADEGICLANLYIYTHSGDRTSSRANAKSKPSIFPAETYVHAMYVHKQNQFPILEVKYTWILDKTIGRRECWI